jgi:hypothetical protein
MLAAQALELWHVVHCRPCDVPYALNQAYVRRTLTLQHDCAADRQQLSDSCSPISKPCRQTKRSTAGSIHLYANAFTKRGANAQYAA